MFQAHVRRLCPPAVLDVHFVPDNDGTTQPGLLRHPRFQLHVTPFLILDHQMERWPKGLITKQIHRGSHRSSPTEDGSVTEMEQLVGLPYLSLQPVAYRVTLAAGLARLVLNVPGTLPLKRFAGRPEPD